MFEFIKFLQKRPTDKTILVGRIIFGLLFIGVTYYNFIYLWKDLELGFVNEENSTLVKYIIVGLWLIPLCMWVSNICLLHKKYMRILQILFSIIIFIISGAVPESPDLDFGVILFFMGLLPLFAGITWKCITTKCIKYKEKITKIRV